MQANNGASGLLRKLKEEAEEASDWKDKARSLCLGIEIGTIQDYLDGSSGAVSSFEPPKEGSIIKPINEKEAYKEALYLLDVLIKDAEAEFIVGNYDGYEHLATFIGGVASHFKDRPGIGDRSMAVMNLIEQVFDPTLNDLEDDNNNYFDALLRLIVSEQNQFEPIPLYKRIFYRRLWGD